MRGSAQLGVNILVNVDYEKPLAAGSDKRLEQAIGVRQAINIRESGLVQVRLVTEGSGLSDLRDRIRSCDIAIHARATSTPSIDFAAAGTGVRCDG
nr:hypothetical protein [uncultured Rhodopila sp.]